MTIKMYDSVTVTEIPTDAPAAACYADGRFANCTAMRARLPHAHILEIAVSASHDAECLDVETGDATPSQAAAWVKRQHARGVARPVVYANTSTMPQVLAALSAAGLHRSDYRVWTAHYTGQSHIEPGSDATQWTDKALGRNLDESLCVDGFFAAPPKPKPKPAPSEPGLSTAQRTMFWRIWNHNPTLVKENAPLTPKQRKLFDAIWNDGWNAHH